MISDFGYILLYIITGIVFLVAMFGVSRLLRPDRPNIEKNSTYESGEEPEGNANVKFNIRFYVVALLFVLFEVELVFLFPWATVFGQTSLIEETNGLWGWFSLGEMFVFVGILALGLAYAWVKGHLDWVRPQPKTPVFKSKIPTELYQKVNEKYHAKP
ncbi:MAG: NADH-quinone oxidoreductase subunit A [Spirosomataceae bacterium]